MNKIFSKLLVLICLHFFFFLLSVLFCSLLCYFTSRLQVFLQRLVVRNLSILFICTLFWTPTTLSCKQDSIGVFIYTKAFIWGCTVAINNTPYCTVSYYFVNTVCLVHHSRYCISLQPYLLFHTASFITVRPSPSLSIFFPVIFSVSGAGSSICSCWASATVSGLMRRQERCL